MLPRPTAHFTPPHNWMNDPNGLIYYEGLYHMYYQHNPLGNAFGNISWGHATSHDLKQWQHHKVALPFTDEAMMYSGCTVVNAVGNLCAIYTEHVGDTEQYVEQICLAESKDGGYSFDQENRRVILTHEDADFRDPKVFWYAPDACWVMCVALPRRYTILFYRSHDLIRWVPSGAFSSPEARGQYWECPDLFPLQNEEGQETWVLCLSGQNADGHSWGMFYFMGTFDGQTFQATSKHQPLDWGSDYYAGITFEGASDRIILAWSGNWAYAGKTTDALWRGMMASPRKLSLRKGQLVQEVISDLPMQRVIITDEMQEIQMQGCRLQWATGLLRVDRSCSPRQYPLAHQHIVYRGDFTRLAFWVDNGILECSLDDGEAMFTVRL